MPKWLLPVVLSGIVQAAAIRGVVVDNQSGRPLARAVVTAQPVAGTAGVPVFTRTNVNGVFELPPVGAGAYLVTATRRAFAPVQYRQKRWKAAGMPLVVAEGGSAEISLRLPRFGSIGGVVADENDVGLPDIQVIAYRNARPPRVVTQAVTDDRGVYRLAGLEPGPYLVRTGPRKGEDDAYLPSTAVAVEVEIDRQTEAPSLRPISGRLVTLTGLVAPQAKALVTLASEMGRQTVTADASGGFRFDSVAPGRYELFAELQVRSRFQGAYTPLEVDRDQEVRVQLAGAVDLQIAVEDTKGQPVDPALVQFLARRKDLAGDARPQTLATQQGHVAVAPGRWDLALMPTAGYYVAKFVSNGPAAERPDGWNEIVANGASVAVKFVLSPNPGVVRGEVAGADGTPAAGAPVYLEGYDADSHRRLTELRTTRTDLEGKYQFYGLPPGAYRILSTFEYQAPDAAAMDAAATATHLVKVEESRETLQSLELYIIP